MYQTIDLLRGASDTKDYRDFLCVDKNLDKSVTNCNRLRASRNHGGYWE